MNTVFLFRHKVRCGLLWLGVVVSPPVLGQIIEDLGILPGDSHSEARFVSADGSVVVGSSYGKDNEGNERTRGFVWTLERGMAALVLPGDTESSAQLSENGSTVAGRSWRTDSDGNRRDRAFVWTAQTGMAALNPLPGDAWSIASAVSADGSTVVGNSNGLGSNGIWRLRSFVWTVQTGIVALNPLPGDTENSAQWISADGSTVVGSSYGLDSNGSWRTYNFIWKVQTGMVALNPLPGDSNSLASAVSADGSTVVGRSDGLDSNGNGRSRVFHWTLKTGMVALVLPGDSNSLAHSVSADGATVAGKSWRTDGYGNWTERGFVWTTQTGMVALVLPGDSISSAYSVSTDGSTVVGWSSGPNSDGSTRRRGFVWAAQTGMVALNPLPGDTYSAGDLVSADGSVVVGSSGNRAVRWTLGPSVAGIDPTAVPENPEPGVAPTNLLAPVSSSGGDPSESKLDVRITQDLNRLVTGGYTLEAEDEAGGPMFGVVSDGVSRLVLRYQASEPGTATISIATAADGKPGAWGLPALDGRLSRDGTAPTSSPLTFTTQPQDGKHYIFPTYHAPSNFPVADANKAWRDLYLKVVFTPAAAGAAKTEFVRVRIQRPPLVLVHGIASTVEKSFPDFIARIQQEIPGLRIHRVNYPNTDSFESNQRVLAEQLSQLRQQMRREGYVATQMDIVAHSMGGLISRRWAGDMASYRTDNYNEGDINRLITVNSPHRGSNIVYLAMGIAKPLPSLWKAWTDNEFASDAALLNMRPDGPAIRELQGRANRVRSHAIIGDFRPAPGFCAITSLNPYFRFFCAVRNLSDWSGISEEASDWVVGVTSQTGGLGFSQTSTFDNAHISLLGLPGGANHASVMDKVLELLRTDPADTVFSDGFPRVPVPLHAPLVRRPREVFTDGEEDAPAIRIVSPAAGTVVARGMNVAVQVEKLDGADLTDVFAALPEIFAHFSSAPFAGTVTIPDTAVGAVTLAVMGRHSDQTYSAAEILLTVDPGADLLSLAVEEEEIYLSRRGVKKRHAVTGTYADGITRDLSSGMTGTTYAVAHPAVASVDADGWVSAVGNGATTLTITHGGKQVTRAVRVALEPEPELTVTASTGGGMAGWLAGEEPRVTFALANTGADAAGNTVVYFTLPEGLSIDETEYSIGTWRVTGDEVAWVVGALAPGANATVTLSLSGAAGSAGEMSVFATSDAPTPLAGANALPLGMRVFRDPAFRLHPGGTAGALPLAWNSETGVTYVLEGSASLAGPWTEISQHPGTGSVHTLSVPQQTEEPKRHFYRLRLKAGM